MRTGLPPVVWWAQGDCPSTLITSGAFLGETEKLAVLLNIREVPGSGLGARITEDLHQFLQTFLDSTLK
jgi:hypothetical protein